MMIWKCSLWGRLSGKQAHRQILKYEYQNPVMIVEKIWNDLIKDMVIDKSKLQADVIWTLKYFHDYMTCVRLASVYLALHLPTQWIECSYESIQLCVLDSAWFSCSSYLAHCLIVSLSASVSCRVCRCAVLAGCCCLRTRVQWATSTYWLIGPPLVFRSWPPLTSADQNGVPWFLDCSKASWLHRATMSFRCRGFKPV